MITPYELKIGQPYWLIKTDSYAVLGGGIEEVLQKVVFQTKLVRENDDTAPNNGYIFSIYNGRKAIVLWEIELKLVFSDPQSAAQHMADWMNNKAKTFEKLANESEWIDKLN